MNTSEGLRALRRAKPRARAEEVAAVRAQVVDLQAPAPAKRRVLALAAAAVLVAATGVAAVTMIGSRGAGIEDATAAVRQAAAVTAATAERSGVATVRITRNGSRWAGARIRWQGRDLAVTQLGGRSRELLVVDGTMYGVEPERGWVELGPASSVDPDSGTTPSEYLAAVREDVGGATLRRITGGMVDPTTTRLDDGSVLYGGRVAASLIARESGFKEGEAIRVLPFGYVAHDLGPEVNAAITVGVDDVVRELKVTWGSWSYTVTYRDLGTAPAPAAPADAEPLRRKRP